MKIKIRFRKEAGKFKAAKERSPCIYSLNITHDITGHSHAFPEHLHTWVWYNTHHRDTTTLDNHTHFQNIYIHEYDIIHIMETQQHWTITHIKRQAKEGAHAFTHWTLLTTTLDNHTHFQNIYTHEYDIIHVMVMETQQNVPGYMYNDEMKIIHLDHVYSIQSADGTVVAIM